jgi:hypothetical protein
MSLSHFRRRRTAIAAGRTPDPDLHCQPTHEELTQMAITMGKRFVYMLVDGNWVSQRT